MLTIDTEKLPIHIWAEEADLNGYDEAIAQAKNLANHPLARKHVALMPDFHVGYGMPIGGVFATAGGVVPNAVGVDIGCGMIAMRTDIEADSLDRDTLQKIRVEIHARVPVGNGPGGNHKEPQELFMGNEIGAEHPILGGLMSLAQHQIGTLGGGNHFLELQKDEDGHVWFMLHSGSRGLGHKVCTHYENVAKAYMKTFHSAIPDPDLAFLPESVPEYGQYLDEMTWCLRFAEASRNRMLDAMTEAYSAATGREFGHGSPIQTHHNYAAMERHMGETVLVHRKGAVKADGPVIIPGSMGTASYVGEGLSNRVSFGTCSHGAGRVLGRKQANRTITHEQAVESMKNVVYGIRQGDYEEMPAAYKDVDRVMENQRDLVSPTHRLVPLAVVKG